MLIGILADIHDAAGTLGRALSHFDRAGVDKVVTLGDAFETYRPGAPSVEVARLLSRAGAVGVWGNHDVGLSRNVPAVVKDRADPELLAFACGLQPQLVIDDCRFSHVEPWLNPDAVADLWYYDGKPDTVKKASRCFKAAPEKFLFMGHHHRWIIMTRQGKVDWDGRSPLMLTSVDRYLVVMAALVDGWCETFETSKARLAPVWCNT